MSNGVDIAALQNKNPPKVEEKLSEDIREQYWQYIHDNAECQKWLDDYNCLGYYAKNKNKIMYDPRLCRLVFLITYNGKYVDAVGRSLKFGVVPKWYRYGKSGLGFWAGDKISLSGDNLVLVEDAASACSVARVCPALALLGTSITNDQLMFIIEEKYKNVTLMLDPDAIQRAMKMRSQLSAFGLKASVANLRDDPKYLSEKEIFDELCK